MAKAKTITEKERKTLRKIIETAKGGGPAAYAAVTKLAEWAEPLLNAYEAELARNWDLEDALKELRAKLDSAGECKADGCYHASDYPDSDYCNLEGCPGG